MFLPYNCFYFWWFFCGKFLKNNDLLRMKKQRGCWHCDITHWGRVTHICVSELTIIGSDNGLSPGWCQAIIWTNAGILVIGPIGTNLSEIVIKIHTLSFKKKYLKMSSAKWRPFCLGLNVFNLFNLWKVSYVVCIIICVALVTVKITYANWHLWGVPMCIILQLQRGNLNPCPGCFLNNYINLPHTVRCCYGAVQYNMILYTVLQKLMQNIDQSLYSQKTPHILPSQVSYGMSFVIILGEIHCVIPTVHCMYGKDNVCGYAEYD